MLNPIEESIAGKFGKTIWKPFHKALKEYQLISPGDRIAVCISGGKDSMLLALCMQRLHRHNVIPFNLEFIVMDPGYAPEVRAKVLANAEKLGVPVRVWDTNVFQSAERSPKNPCFLCARLRRGWLYQKAQELGCNKIALGHHFDDVIETILMGMLYGSQIQTMMPKLRSENYPVEVIRPLYLVREENIKAWVSENGLEFIQCACSVSARETKKESKRAKVGQLLKTLRETDPAVDMNIFRSVENVNLRTLISYHSGDEYHHFLDNY